MDDPRTDAGDAAYRGFLFSDLRDFTAFVERHGNAEAAALVDRFLEVSRAAVARHDGAAIKTEGDSIHAVFPAASSAVMCGLEIVDAAVELSAEDPARPLRVGVGVHAGEAVATEGGYIGTAVNLAARVCAAARPGEVLVTSTVKGITQANIPVGFIARGRRRLKGIAEPVEVFAVTRDTTLRPPLQVPRPVALGAFGLAVVGLAAMAALFGSQFLPNPRASALASATASAAAPAAQDVVIGPLPIGTYRSQAFQPPLTFGIPDQGWTANRDLAEVLGLVREVAPRGSVAFLRVSDVFADPCVEAGDGVQTGLAAADLFAELENLPHLAVTNRQAVEVGGAPGEQADVTVSEGALAACGGLVGSEVAIFGAGDEVWRASSGERFRLVAVDVADQAVTILLSTDWTESQSVQELEDLLELGERILASVAF
jgi:class 3 adenylate cyclase